MADAALATVCLLGHPCGGCHGQGWRSRPVRVDGRRTGAQRKETCSRCNGNGRAPTGRFGCRFCLTTDTQETPHQ